LDTRGQVLAKRHKVEAKKDSATTQELLAKQVGTYDEAELCKLLLEIAEAIRAYSGSLSANSWRLDKLQSGGTNNLRHEHFRAAAFASIPDDNK
jgi:hypothetical protein